MSDSANNNGSKSGDNNECIIKQGKRVLLHNCQEVLNKYQNRAVISRSEVYHVTDHVAVRMQG